MIKKIAIIFVAIVALVIGGWFIFSKKVAIPKPKPGPFKYLSSPSVNPATVATASAKIDQIEVDYTDSGFNPAIITIKKGTAVVFYNKTKNPMLIGSKLPEFNQTIEGNIYAYTFNQIGDWSFQNQKHPSDKGTITVKE